MSTSQTTTRPRVPEVGRRGGLGRTLLTAFLIMAILPLSAISWYATHQTRLIIQNEVLKTLASVAELKESQMSRWIEETNNALLAADSSTREILFQRLEVAATGSESITEALVAEQQSSTLALLNSEGYVELASDSSWQGLQIPLPVTSSPEATLLFVPAGPTGEAEAVLVHPAPTDSNWSHLAAVVTPELTRILEETAGLGDTGSIYLVDQRGIGLPQGEHLPDLTEFAPDTETGQGLYTNYAGVPSIGIHQSLDDLGLTLVVEQSQEEAFAGTDAIATAVIVATLGAALATAFIAAIVTRQITQPLVNLTESALNIATGDLSQRVEVKSRDEIGILARVFNRMASELEVLYSDLEAKVAERTHALQRANYQIQRRAIQMQASLEVGQVVTSILDPDRLLEEIVRVVRTRFVYSYAAVYVKDRDGEHLVLRASAGEAVCANENRIPTNHSSPIGRAFRECSAQVESQPVTVTVGPPTNYTRSEAVLPLRLGDRTLGTLDVQTMGQESFDQDDVSVLQNVANQITIALENAGAYAKEREAARRLRELDESKRRFLSNMSHELRTPLNNIIGFSRLLLKGVGGELASQQYNDIEIIYHNGQHLLGLINDLLDVSQIEAGLMELQFRETDLAELIRSVMATASALIRDKDISLRAEIAPDLPLLQADPTRIRQVLLRLLANAAKFTEEGIIMVQARPDNGQVIVSISDTGIGITPQDQKRIFQRFEQGKLENGRRPDGAGLGLALSKEFVEMHGGTIWVESVVDQGSCFTFTLPIQPPASKTEAVQP